MSKFPPIHESMAEFAANMAAISRTQKATDRLLKGIAKRQEETDRLLKENAERQKTTDRSLKEVAEQQKTTDRSLKEVAEQQKTTDRSLEETRQLLKENAEQQKATDRLLKENAEQQKVTDRRIKDVIGVGESSGLIFEDEVADAIHESHRIGNVSLDAITVDFRSKAGNQFDIVGVNGKYVVVTEVKQTLNMHDVVRFAEDRMAAFGRDFLPQMHGRKLKGALIYRRLGGRGQAAAKEALSRGLILVRAVGKNKLCHVKTMADAAKPAREVKTAAK